MTKMKSSRYRNDGAEKLCTGFLHKDNPTWLPVEKFPVFKSAPRGLEWRLGKPMPECWECRRARIGQNPRNGWISREEAWPIFAKLIQIAGNKQEACKLLGKIPSFLSRKNKNFRGEVVRQAEQLVYELEKDRTFFGVEGRSEAEIVDPQPFGRYIDKFLTEWETERPSDRELVSKHGWMTGIGYLHEKTGIAERRIFAFRKGEIERVPLSQADLLLQAMNLTHLLGLEIQVRPNPTWSLENYQAYMRRSGCV